MTLFLIIPSYYHGSKGAEMTQLTESQVESAKVFDGVLLQVYKDRVVLPDGRESVREYIRHPGAAVMIPLLKTGELIMERQYRYPLRQELLELPAGKIDAGEDPVESARRELLEETGYRGGRFTRLGVVHPCIGYSDEVIYIYLVENLTFHSERQDKDEFIETFRIGLQDAVEGIRAGRITDGKTITGIYWAEKLVRNEWALPDNGNTPE